MLQETIRKDDNVVTLSCAKNRRCELSRVLSPLKRSLFGIVVLVQGRAPHLYRSDTSKHFLNKKQIKQLVPLVGLVVGQRQTRCVAGERFPPVPANEKLLY